MSASRLHPGLLALAIALTPLCLSGQAREWSERRILTWEDFRGTPDPSSKAAALTAYEIQARTGCQNGRSMFRVDVIFLPHQSWILPKQRLPRTLAHEQGHFDLGEVTARQLRAALTKLESSCEAAGEAFMKTVADFQQRDAELQRSYDRQTLFGTDSGTQRKWEAQIAAWLRSGPAQ